MSQLYEFTNYKSYLTFRISEARGNLTKLAEAAGCQPSYLSRVCSTKIQLTQDHAFRLARYWAFENEHRQYFMDLVDMERAADPGLRNALLNKIRSAQAKHSNLQDRTSRPAADTSQTTLVYHSQWVYSAIHFLTSTPSFRSVEAIAKRLWLPENTVKAILGLLQGWELVTKNGGNFEFAGGAAHIPKGSPVLPLFHANWRTKAVQDCQNLSSDGLHFTNVQTVSRSDYERIKQMAVRFVEETTEVATPSAPEDLVVVVCDVFRP